MPRGPEASRAGPRRAATREGLLGDDRAAFVPRPATPFDACVKRSTATDARSLVRFDDNDDSVPVRSAHHPVVVRADVDRVVLGPKGEVIATHRRLWGREGVSFDPVHDLTLRERKPGALDHARPRDGWEWPDGFAVRSALAFAACAPGRRVRFFTVTGWVTPLLEKRQERSLEKSQRPLERMDLLVLDEWGSVPFSQSGGEVWFEVVSRASERTSRIVTTNLPFESWPEVLGSERLTGAMLDRLTHRVQIIAANGESFRLRESKRRQRRASPRDARGSRQGR